MRAGEGGTWQRALGFRPRVGHNSSMEFLRQLLGGFGALFAITTPPLYRYPYRKNAEGLRGDWLRVGGDIQAAVDNTQEDG